MRKLLFALVVLCGMLVTTYGALAGAVDINDGCHVGDSAGVVVGFIPNVPNTGGSVVVENECASGTSVQFIDANLTLGPIEEGEVVITDNSVSVDTVARPDLEVPGRIVFRNVRFVLEPSVLRNGEVCGVDCTYSEYDTESRTYVVDVAGFSTYTLQARQDFTVYSDPEAELRGKVYQTIDLGDGNRSTEYACMVQIYGQNEGGDWVLVQTNPKREVQARLWGSPDANQPESLGYFPTKNGMANVYYDGSTLAGYNDFEYVAQCANNQTKWVFEESISTRYVPLGRNAVGRGVWLTSGTNALFLAFYVLVGGIVLFLLVRLLRVVWNGLTGRR